jgi:hypothetical protein
MLGAGNPLSTAGRPVFARQSTQGNDINLASVRANTDKIAIAFDNSNSFGQK